MMDYVAAFKFFSAVLLPPINGATDANQFWNAFLLRVVAYGAFVLVITGAIVSVGFFATKSEVLVISSELTGQRAEEDKDSILTLRSTECALPPGKSKDLYTVTITTRMQEYFKLTGNGFVLPNCSDF